LGVQFSALAHKNNLIINDTFESQLLSEEFSVYYQESRVLGFEEFRNSRNLLPYRHFKTSNFGLLKNGAWLYTTIENRSDIKKLILSIRFSQLQNANLYITSKGKLIHTATDGIQAKTSPYPLPSFELDLPRNTPLEVYIYVKSSSMSLVAPIYLQTNTSHAILSMLNASIWGAFYGVLLVLFIYALAFVRHEGKVLGGLYIMHLVVMLMFQLLWSGHSALLFNWLNTLFLHLRTESMVMLMSISATLLNLRLTPNTLHKQRIRKLLTYLLYTNAFFLFVFFVPILSPQIELSITYTLGFTGLIVNLLFSANAYRHGFSPARSLMIGWISCIIGSFLSVCFIFGILQSNPFHQHIFHFTLLVQTCIFMLTMVLRTQYDLELDVKEAETDALNNFTLIEEQNVHLDIARKEAEKASVVKSQFLANMSHEIRTPLNAIMGFSKELENDQNILEREEHVRIINSSAGDLLTVVNDILDISKMEAGKLILNTRPFSPRHVLEDVAALMSKNAHLKKLEFVFEVGSLPDFILGDAFKVKQLLSNLLSNAHKFTNHGHIKLTTKVIEQSDTRCIIEFKVIDSGIGISQSDMNQLFKAFHQLDDDLNRSYQGSGLGLVICKELTSLMGGEITVTSKPSEGSVFTATIPFNIDCSATQLARKPAFEGQMAYIVDDWNESRKATRQQLEAVGFEIKERNAVSQLSNIELNSDYVFVALPLRNIEARSGIIEKVYALHPRNLVFMYSGPEPNLSVNNPKSIHAKIIRMPLTTRKLKDIDSRSQQPHASFPNQDVAKLPNIRILAVDDMELNLRLLQTWLKNTSITLDLAYDGKSAIERCQHTEYDLILMDIQMPNIDGLQATRAIRKTALNIGTPIIAVSAHAMEDERQHFLDSGMDDFLPKPIKLDNLITLINMWCASNSVDEPQYEDTSHDLKGIDWDMALELCYNDKEGAIDYLDSFIERLHIHANEIESGWGSQQVEVVSASIHKLHGACCYTGVPRLESYCSKAHIALKEGDFQDHAQTISKLLLEIEALIEEWPILRKSLVK
jgi:two-component system sensor histidine kinase BarA